eukprot:TRINITY_DN527_c0_g1_i1.p1 TRINITY_DN527_c0_g1~~TRINITY_DN527_c0_g1_i1.p1  ORF type:complete len:334 (-),score=63.04 TRINITY_DN527_c0_g1_i1:198-1199(-)
MGNKVSNTRDVNDYETLLESKEDLTEETVEFVLTRMPDPPVAKPSTAALPCEYKDLEWESDDACLFGLPDRVILRLTAAHCEFWGREGDVARGKQALKIVSYFSILGWAHSALASTFRLVVCKDSFVVGGTMTQTKQVLYYRTERSTELARCIAARCTALATEVSKAQALLKHAKRSIPVDVDPKPTISFVERVKAPRHDAARRVCARPEPGAKLEGPTVDEESNYSSSATESVVEHDRSSARKLRRPRRLSAVTLDELLGARPQDVQQESSGSSAETRAASMYKGYAPADTQAQMRLGVYRGYAPSLECEAPILKPIVMEQPPRRVLLSQQI